MKYQARLTPVVGLVLALTGCGGTPESKLIGTWKTSQSSLVGNSGQSATKGAKMLAAASVDIRADKTFSFTLDTSMEGMWTMDASSGVATLTVTKVTGTDVRTTPEGRTAPQTKLTAQVDGSGSTLSIQPADPKAAESGIMPTFRFERS